LKTENLVAGYAFRAYREEDRATVGALGATVFDSWHAKGLEASAHQVAVYEATAEIVGHLQVVDKSVPEPSRRPGQCHFTLNVASAHRRRGIGGVLY
jgi:hypothetical protein